MSIWSAVVLCFTAAAAFSFSATRPVASSVTWFGFLFLVLLVASVLSWAWLTPAPRVPAFARARGRDR